MDVPTSQCESRRFCKNAHVPAEQSPGTTAELAPVTRGADIQSLIEGRGRIQHGSPAINVNTLADQVMRQLDRRLMAWRERTGRI
jgi:hypothetical protein